ncbi:MAG: response regulator [Desulfobacteraceae bacterium]|nr:response regulator [Desulfobacteraceae bacterium]
MHTILVIDDNEDFRYTLMDLLELEGYEVIGAADGNEGVELYRQNPVELVITDLIMPKKEGIETIQELCRDYPDVKIIAISGGGRSCSDPGLFLCAATDLGSMKSFQKPLDRVKFLAAVRDLLSGD